MRRSAARTDSRLLCTFARSKGTPEENSMTQSDDAFDDTMELSEDDPATADILAADGEDSWEDDELAPDETADEDGDYATTEVLSGEELERRKADEATVDDDDENEMEGRGAEEIGAEWEEDNIQWGRMDADELQREVEDLYPKTEDTSQMDLLRARAEITREELASGAEGEAFDLDAEIDKLIEFQRKAQSGGSEEAAKARRKSSGIPGEIVEGPPEYPMLADYERAHDLHAQIAKRPVVDVDKLATVLPDVREAERFKEYIPAENVTRMIKAGKVKGNEALVAEGMEKVVLEVMNTAVKLAVEDSPDLTAPGGALYESTQVFGDLYPTMIVRLTFRHIQYALLAGEKRWRHAEGLRTFAELLKEMETSVDPIALLLRCGVTAFADAMKVPADTTRAVLMAHVDSYVAELQEVYTTVATKRMLTRADFGENWREHWDELPLREIWDGKVQYPNPEGTTRSLNGLSWARR